MVAADWLEKAHYFAGEIERCARPGRGDSLTWQDPGSSEGNPLGPHFYAGDAGIALFFAALEHVTHGGRYRDLSLAALVRIRHRLIQILNDPAQSARVNLKLGSMIGLGGLIYTFVRAGQWLEEGSLIEEAFQLSTLITPERIAGDSDLDVAHGSAGALISLLLLHEAASGSGLSSQPLLDGARACARHLLERRLRYKDQPKAWPFPHGESPLCGFAHGAAGIAFALLRLYHETGEEDLLEAAQEGMEFERGHYEPGLNNWRDLRDPNGRSFMLGWCHGAPGIALSRLGMLGIVEEQTIRGDLDLALRSTRSADLSPMDHLCCGNMGRVEILLYAYQRLRDEELLARATALAAQVLERGEEAGGRFGLVDQQGRPCFHPSLFLGAAGLGFTFLRLSAPDALPCPLLLE